MVLKSCIKIHEAAKELEFGLFEYEKTAYFTYFLEFFD